jgi:hypothetical protein
MAGRLGFDLCDPRYSDGHRDYAYTGFVRFDSAETQERVFSNSINIQNSVPPSGEQLEALQCEDLKLGGRRGGSAG